jgi:glycosyltransferase involved in cell wall biosynthesis
MLTGCKLVYDAHELESSKNGQTRAFSKGILFVERFCWRWVDLLVSVSDSILDWYRDHLGPKESILVLNSPEIDARTDAGSGAGGSGRYFHVSYAIPGDKLVFVYLGILGAGRGIEIALDAFASSSLDAHLVLVGYGDLSAHIQSYCDRHENIHLHKPVPHDQVVALVAAADVGLCLVENVSLSDYYCLPNKLFEYCFAGLHILGSDFPEIRKVIDEYSLGTCCALEPSKVREAIQFLIDHRPTRTATDFSALSWEAQAERLLHGYRKLLDPRSDVKPIQDGFLPK